MADEEHPERRAQAQQDEAILGVRMVGILDDQGIFVKKRGMSLVEGHLVLLDVGSSLVGVPFEPQLRHQLHRSYTAWTWQVRSRDPAVGPSNTADQLRSSDMLMLRQLHPLVRRLPVHRATSSAPSQ